MVLTIVLIVLSCSVEVPYTVTLRIADDHPFEILASEDMWYILRYFDGKGVVERYIPASTRTIKDISVYTGGLRPFVVIPLGTLGPIGGMLIGASEYRPEAVSRLSVSAILKDYPDLALIDELEFLDDLFSGTLRKGQLKLYERDVIMLDSVPEGEWVSERYDTPSFSVVFSGRPVYLELHPGVFRFMNWKRGLLLTIAVTEEWERSANISKSPVWY